MKINELEINKIYKPNNYEYTHNLYKMTKDGLEVKFEDLKWQKSDLSFNELFTYDFEEYIREIDWFKIPGFTPILCDINGDKNGERHIYILFQKYVLELIICTS